MSTGSGDEIARKINRSLAWVGAAQTAVSLIDIVSVLLILRLWVSAADYGTAMLAYTLFPALDLIGDLFAAGVIVHKEGETREKLSTIFWLSMLISAGVFVILCGVGPLLAWMHRAPAVAWMFIAYGGKVVFQNVYTIPAAIMRRDLRFGELSAIRVIANFVEAVTKVTLAAAGVHIWCFILAAFSRVIITAVGVQWRCPWLPRFVWRPREASAELLFGVRAAASQLLYHVYANLDYQVVGYFFGKAALGLYTAAFTLILEPVKIISGVVEQVAFPAFARLRHDPRLLFDQLVQFTRVNLAIVLPFVALMALICGDFTALVIPEWTAAVTAVRVLCLAGLLRALSAIGPPLLYGIGRPQLVLRYMIAATLTLPALYVIFAVALKPLGFVSVAVAWAAGYPIAFAVLAYLVVRAIHLPAMQFARRIGGVAACTPLAAVPAWAVMMLLRGVAPLPRLVATTGVFLTILYGLLSSWQKMSPRAIAGALAKK